MLNIRSSLLIAVGSLILPLAMPSQGTAAGPQLHMQVSASLLHNAQIRNCIWRYPNGRFCRGRTVGVGLNSHTVYPEDCRCVHTRTITGGGGTPGTVEVRPPRNTIRGTSNPDGSVEVRRPD
jgi:hypothetical protein